MPERKFIDLMETPVGNLMDKSFHIQRKHPLQKLPLPSAKYYIESKHKSKVNSRLIKFINI